MSLEPKATIRVGGQEFSDWQEVSIRASYGGDGTGEFEFIASEMDSIAPHVGSWRVMAGMDCEILLDGQLVITGNIEVRQAGYGPEDHAVSFQGRGKVGDLIDSSAEETGGQYRGYTIDAIAKAVTQKYGITSKIEAQGGPGRPFEDVQIYPAETVFEFLERLARMRGFFLAENESGELLIAKADTSSKAVASLTEGVNIYEATGILRSDTAFSKTTVKSQRQSFTDDDWGELSTGIIKSVEKQLLQGRYRPQIIIAEEPSTEEDAQERAENESARGIGEGTEAAITVTGWKRDDGSVWLPGDVAHVKSPMLLIDRELVVRDIEWSQGPEGTFTMMQMVPAEALSGQDSGGGGFGVDDPGGGFTPSDVWGDG